MSRTMRVTRIVFLTLAIITVAIASQPQTTIHVKEVPPEAIPAGTCTESTSGVLGVVEKEQGKERTKLTPKEIGEYVSKRLSEGYSVVLYPQPNDKVFSIATCESIKH